MLSVFNVGLEIRPNARVQEEMDDENLEGESRKAPLFADGAITNKDPEEPVMNIEVEMGIQQVGRIGSSLKSFFITVSVKSEAGTFGYVKNESSAQKQERACRDVTKTI